MENDIPNLHYVDDFIYRSGILTDDNIEHVKELDIKTIVSMKTNIVDTHIEKEWCQHNGIKFCHVPMLLVPEIDEKKVIKAVKEISNRQHPLLVHCTHGSDRTGTVIAIYRILKNNWTYDDAIAEMEKYGFNPIFNVWKHFILKVANHRDCFKI